MICLCETIFKYNGIWKISLNKNIMFPEGESSVRKGWNFSFSFSFLHHIVISKCRVPNLIFCTYASTHTRNLQAMFKLQNVNSKQTFKSRVLLTRKYNLHYTIVYWNIFFGLSRQWPFFSSFYIYSALKSCMLH